MTGTVSEGANFITILFILICIVAVITEIIRVHTGKDYME